MTAPLEVDHVGELSGGTQLAVCAIVPEALANTARHAGPGKARVTVRRENDAVLVTATDGPVAGWVPYPGAGAGLAGLRERVGHWAAPCTPGRVPAHARLPETTDRGGTPMTAPVRVLVVDDQPLIRHSLRLIIDGAPDLAVAGEADTGRGLSDQEIAAALTISMGTVKTHRQPAGQAPRPRPRPAGHRRVQHGLVSPGGAAATGRAATAAPPRRR